MYDDSKFWSQRRHCSKRLMNDEMSWSEQSRGLRFQVSGFRFEASNRFPDVS